VLHTAVARYGRPEIINSDQGSQCTCEHWVSTKELGIEISMDGKARATDNAFIERFFGTRKRIYLNPAKDGLELYQGVAKFALKYNRRNHREIDSSKPVNLYLKAA